MSRYFQHVCFTKGRCEQKETKTILSKDSKKAYRGDCISMQPFLPHILHQSRRDLPAAQNCGARERRPGLKKPIQQALLLAACHLFELADIAAVGRLPASDGHSQKACVKLRLLGGEPL